MRSSAARTARRLRRAPPARGARQETLEAEAVAGQARDGEGGRHGGGAGHARHPDARVDGGPHEAEPRVGDRRHAGVGGHDDDRAVGELAEERAGALGLVALEATHQQPTGRVGRCCVKRDANRPLVRARLP